MLLLFIILLILEKNIIHLELCHPKKLVILEKSVSMNF